MPVGIGVHDNVHAWLGVAQGGTMAALLAQVQQQCTQDWEKQWLDQLQQYPVTSMPQERGQRIDIPAKASGELLRLVRRVEPAVEFTVDEEWQAVLDQQSERWPDHTPLLAALANHLSGQIVTTGKTETQKLLLQLLSCFSDAKVVICCRNRQEQKKLVRYLSSRLQLRIETGLSKDVNETPGVFVLNTWDFEQGARNPEYDVLVIMEADLTTQVRINEAIQQRPNARCYVFRHRNQEYMPEHELSLLHSCGSVIHETATRTELRRLKLPTSALPPLPRPSRTDVPGELEYRYKVEQIWENPQVNGFLVDLMRALRQRDWQRLLLLGLPDDRDLQERVQDGIEAVVVVESVRHGEELLKLLPEAHLATRQGARMGQIAAEPEELDFEQLAESWFPQILTVSAVATEMPQDAVLICPSQAGIPDTIIKHSFDEPITWIIELTPLSH